MNKAIDILVIEDNPADIDLIREYLSEVIEFSVNLFSASTLKEGQNFLKKNAMDVVLVDLSLPDSQNLDTLKAVIGAMRKSSAIVLTSSDNKENALFAIELGAQDYVLKNSLGPEMLARVIRYSIQRSKWQQKMLEVQEQLNQSQKMESIGRLTGGIAHDFNNHLAVTTLLCPLIIEKLPADHAAQKYVQQILDFSKKSTEVVKRLMAFSRKYPAELKVVDLHIVLKESEALLSKILGENILISVVLASEKALVRIDQALMENAIVNLSINARDAMPNGGKLTFETFIKAEQVSPEQSGTVILKITDTGDGIDPVNVTKIFEPFFTTKALGKGTGLGLAMVYGTVEQCGGKISVESILKQGTSFSITLPLSKIEVSAENDIPIGKVDKRAVDQCILVVEDEDSLREAFSEFLMNHGYKVFTAQNGVEAFQKLSESGRSIDLVITDLNMPNMGGVELREKVILVNPAMKFMLTSGYSDKIGGLDMLTLKNTAYLPKPATSEMILTKIRQLLAK